MIKFLVALFVLVLGCNFGYSQSKPFKQLAAELNQLTESYSRLLPFQGDKRALKDFSLTVNDFPETEDENFSAQKDSIDFFALQEYYQGKIWKKLIALTSHNDFGTASNEKLVNIFATKSADNKVYNFIYDENTGGSYQSRVSYVYYASQKGEQKQSLYNPDGYDTIIPIKSKTATRYLMLGEKIGCNSCMGHYAKLVHYEKGQPVVDFEYSLGTRMGFDNAIEYNAASSTLSVHYTTDDLTQYCYCNEGDKKEYTDEITPQHQCSCTFTFNGDTFVLAGQKDNVVKN